MGTKSRHGSLNIRSLSPLKLDTLLVESRERSIDVLALCETWHDGDSVAIRRLRADVFSVVEWARPRRIADTRHQPRRCRCRRRSRPDGSRHIWAAGHSTCEHRPARRCHHQSCMESLKDRSLRDCFPAVRRRPAEADQTSPVVPSRLLRWHSNLRLLSAEWRHWPRWQSVRLHRWSVILDAGQPAAGESIKDWGALMLFWLTTASDPDLVSTRRQYLCAASIFCTRPRGIHRLRRQPANPHHCHHQVVLCSTTTDLERAVLSSTACLADTNPCISCQQGRLLLFSACWCLRSSTGQTSVNPQLSRPTHILSQALRTHHSASPRPSLVAGDGTDSIPSLRSGLPMSERISAAISRWEHLSDSRRGRSSPPPLVRHHDGNALLKFADKVIKMCSWLDADTHEIRKHTVLTDRLAVLNWRSSSIHPSSFYL